MYFAMSDLAKKLSFYENIIIYGVGNFAKTIYPRLKALNLSHKISSFAVSDKVTDQLLDNIPVRTIMDIDCEKADTVVLVAVSEIYEQEIVTVLKSLSFCNVLLLTDFLRTEYNVESYFENLDFDGYCKCMTDWYFFENYQKVTIEKARQLIDSVAYSRGQKKLNQVVYVTRDTLKPRLMKIAKALKKKGFQVIILHSDYYNSSIERAGNILRLETLEKLGIIVKKCSNIEELLYQMLNYNPLVYYLLSKWGDALWESIIIKRKKFFGTIIAEAYDVIAMQIGQQKKYDAIMKERYVFENADGIIWRWYAKDFLESERGYHFKGKSIQFLDYCQGYDDMTELGEDTNEPGTLKICVVSGNMQQAMLKRNEHEHYEMLAGIPDIMEKVGSDDVIVHYYIGRGAEADKQKAKELEKKYPKFTIFWGTDYRTLIEKLKEYDYGCGLLTEGKYLGDDVWNEEVKMSVSNRVFDYIEAGLPVITTAWHKQCEYLEQFGVIVKMNLNSLDFKYLKKNCKTLKENVQKARNELSIDNQIARLITFFRSFS